MIILIHYFPPPAMADTSSRVRTTISVDPEVLMIFTQMADAGGMSVGRCIGEWLADTADGAQMIAQKMIDARRAPMVVMRELQAEMYGAQEELQNVIRKIQSEKLLGSTRSAVPMPVRAVVPPSSNTGVLVPPSPSKTTTTRRVKKS